MANTPRAADSEALTVPGAEPRDLRYRKQLFPGAENEIFDTSTKGYVPLPILLRKMLKYLTPQEVRVLLYLYTRSSKYRMCYPTIEEIAEELGLNRKYVTPHVNSLVEKRLIRTETLRGRRFFLSLDPRIALEKLVASGEIRGQELFALNELCIDLKRAPFAAPPAEGKVV